MHSFIQKGFKTLLKIRLIRKIVHRLFFLSLETNTSTFPTFSGSILALAIEDMESSDEGPLSDQLWTKLEPIYISSRRKLLQSRKWRYGNLFVWDNVKPVIEKLAQHHISIIGKTYCDLGCGTHHPFGTSAIMYINGANSTIATDIQNFDKRRAAEALYELLQDCFVNPDMWHWSSSPRDEYLARLHSFNLRALSKGDFDAGLANLPLKHIVTSIYEPQIPLGSIDVMTSRSVLEHFLDFEMACDKLKALMSPKGVAYHLIDLVDHRSYSSFKFHRWSFLAEDEQ
jgi:Methyltransferase domain